MESAPPADRTDSITDRTRLDLSVGGQALIEGVMIRSPRSIAIALRTPRGIAVETRDYVNLVARTRWLSLPVLRGVVSFFEMLGIGLNALTYSANVAASDGCDTPVKDRISPAEALLFLISFGLGVGLFVFLPMALATLAGLTNRPVAYNLFAGTVRILVFLFYLWAIGKIADVKRVFEYHGAEHKVVAAFESGLDSELTAQTARGFPRFHPRCGTSFVFLVVAVAIAFYAITDSLYALYAGNAPDLETRFLLHLACLPVVAGLGYEVLKATGKSRNSRRARYISKPGLLLQRLTTREPNDDQLSVAIAAVRAAVGLPQETGGPVSCAV
ncbi:MAG TPA: DUF1385 domain-containing protein [Candidatus Latescibacteria bacterium]|nr:DUF1385 domain-containing protein [Candidatus Latescibacterota bacterium]